MEAGGKNAQKKQQNESTSGFSYQVKSKKKTKKSIWMEKKRKIPRSKRQKYTNIQNRVIPKKKTHQKDKWSNKIANKY